MSPTLRKLSIRGRGGFSRIAQIEHPDQKGTTSN